MGELMYSFSCKMYFVRECTLTFIIFFTAQNCRVVILFPEIFYFIVYLARKKKREMRQKIKLHARDLC